jgi:hypothetical protein
MKTIYIIVFFLVLVPFNFVLFSQTPDSCLKLLRGPYEKGYVNPDSIKVDSCTNSITFGQAYAKVWFAVQFIYNVLPRGDPPTYDSNYEYTWQDIDEAYSLTRDGFQQLEKKFGIFWFRDVHLGFPDTSADTTSMMPWRQLDIRFGNYVNIDSVIVFLKAITYVKWCDYMWMAGIKYWVPEDEGIKARKSENIIIYPQPAGDNVIIQGLTYNGYDQIEIFSTTGYLLRSSEITPYSDIDFKTEDLPSGYYFLKIGKIILPLIISR